MCRELNRSNRSAGHHLKISDAMLDVLQLVQAYCNKTEGVFDHLVPRALQHAGYNVSFDLVKLRDHPVDVDIFDIQKHQALAINPETQTIELPHQINFELLNYLPFCKIKGYTIERLIKLNDVEGIMQKGSLRLRLMLILAFAVTVPLIGSGYLLIHRSEQALMNEKENKLFGIAHTLDNAMLGNFDNLLSEKEKSLPREAKIKLLNARLKKITDQIVLANPGVGAGYYSKDLDAIITYGPSSEYGNTIGESIAPDHKGREVMTEGIPLAIKGPMVRGNILNSMVPMFRNGRVIGYVWANELTESIDSQIQKMEASMYLALGLALLLGLGITLFSANMVSASVQLIVTGLRRLRADLNHRLPMSSGEFGEITAAINDMAQNLRNTRSHTEIIMESMADGIITVDTAGKVTALNAAATSITGLGKEIIGTDYSDIQTQGWLLETLNTGKTFIGYEMDFPHASGRIVPISVSTSLLHNGEKPLGAVVVFKDLTDRKSFEERVRRVDRLAAVGELAAGVAHEIRNPLTAISGSVQLMLGEISEDNPIRNFGNIILKEVSRLNVVVEDLLYFARPSKNFIARIQPNELIRETVELLTPSMKKDLVSLQVILDPDVQAITVDAGLIKQVLVNLLLNAIQSLPAQGGHITVTTHSVENGVKLGIQDTGEGIATENLVRIFDPFFTTKDRGTGLGLAVSSKIIEIHHGYLEVESELGVGTLFKIFLPYESSEEPKGETSGESEKEII
ncbi:Sensory histidine kinase AtoS [Desulfosporosinus metallidurans]|uniref:histidine kinase n=2 Tax=Desulfosporosinus metallidurans TaxID=1888891 RepID=A0A1Q8QX00_9FIRM|nr:Sensory histidine kinase AtoS [Desulfosporosinus metallidurans]